MTTLALKESADGHTYTKCPNCSKMYGWTVDRDGKTIEQDIPTKCKRCGCPMDIEKALAFADAEARKAHNPVLSDLGNRVRGMTHPTMDRQVKAAPNK